jgi:hypothetical protein
MILDALQLQPKFIGHSFPIHVPSACSLFLSFCFDGNQPEEESSVLEAAHGLNKSFQHNHHAKPSNFCSKIKYDQDDFTTTPVIKENQCNLVQKHQSSNSSYMAQKKTTHKPDDITN